MADHYPVTSLAAALLFASAVLRAPAAESDPQEVARKVMARVADNSGHIQNYTCVETVERDYFQPAASTLNRACSAILAGRQHPTPDMVLKLQGTDRLRLDVANTQKGEIFSWVGASRFDDQFVDNVVHEGPIGSGAFGAYLSVIFELDARTLTYLGTVTYNGRKLMQYTFAVPQSESHYRIRLSEGDRVSSGYSGSVLVDPETGDPVHLTLRTDELPEATGSCQSLSDLDYKRVQIGNHELLLAERAHQRFIGRNGSETENSTTFASCREYSSESTLNFYQDPGPSSGAAATAPASAAPAVPAGLRLVFELTTPIETATAAVGDRFTAKLTEPLRDGRQILAPKGAAVAGRITTMNITYFQSRAGLVGLSPRTVEIKGAKVPLTALPDRGTLFIAGKKSPKKGLEIFLPPRGEYSGIFQFNGSGYVFRRGFASEWVTVFQPRSR